MVKSIFAARHHSGFLNKSHDAYVNLDIYVSS